MAYSSARNHLNLQVKTLLASSTHDPGMAQPMDHSAVALPPATIHEQQDPESAGTTAALYKEQHPHPPTSAHTMSKALTINHQHSIQQRPHSTPLPPPKQRSHKRLHQTFQLPTTEKLIAEFPSWLFRSVLLKGFVYLTDAHICFHAFLNSNEREPDEDRAATKSGILSRRHARKLNQPHSTIKSWFILKDTILSWYPSSHEPYFPTGQIDLHFCTKVEPAPPNSKHPNQFKLVVSGKVYTFCSDTQQSKDEWVKALQQTVFASQHGGQNVKLAIPLTSIETIEKCDSIQFAQTVCIKIKQNVPVVPFAQKKPSTIPPEEIGDRSLVDYFFGFLQDSQTPYELLIAALERVQASSPATVVVAPQDPSTSSLPSPIRDSTRFKIITHSSKPTAEHYASNLSPAVMSSCSGSQTPISSDTNHPQSSSNPDERKTKFTDKITKIASTSNKFVGSPIRPAFDTVKVHSPRPMSASAILPRTMESFTRPSTPDSAPSSLIFQSTPPPPSSSTLDQAVKKLPDSPLKLDKLARSSSLAQQSPKDRRPQYSTYSPRGEKLDTSTPTSTHNNSPIPTPHESPYVEPNKSWALLPGWIKNVPVTLINPAKGTPNSPKASSTPQDHSPVSATKKDVPTRSASTDKLSDEDRSHREAQLTPRDQLKFETEFNFLSPGTLSKSTHSEGTMIRLLLKTKCNLIRGGSSMYGQVYLASPVHSPKQIRNLRKSCICFKGQKWISSAPVKMILPIEALTAVRTEAIKLYLTTQPTDLLNGQEEVCFEFATAEQMKPVHDEVMRMIESNKLQIGDEQPQAEAEVEANKEEENEDDEEDDDESSLPIMFQSSSSSFLTFKPKSKLHITCLTIGSRGDVQPYIALCQQLQLDGHTCRIASHGEYRKWVEGYGIEYVEIGGDPAELMKICVDNGMFTLGFLKEAFSKFRGWLDELLVSSFDACQGTDLLIESPSTMAGIHIAEALQIPYFRAFTMPWTRTKEYPHAFAVPDRKMGSGYNYMTYTVFDQVFWKAMSGQVNKWRKEKLGLRSTTYEKLEIHKVPFLYNFSPSIVPSPLDWYEWIHVTGYWFINEDDPNKLHQQPSLTQSSDPLSDSLIDTHQSPIAQIDSQSSTVKSPIGKPTAEKSSWDPPADLVSFLDRAHGQNKKVVYIGFGSIVVPDPEATTKVIIESVKSAGVYAIISKGWSERLQQSSSGTKKGKRAAAEDEHTEEPEDLSMIYHINSIPHDWLFPRIDAVCHHGGAGTTGASLRAGLPTIIKPFFGDQFFWAERVESLGIGAAIRKLTVKNLALALLHATSDPTQISRAKLVGQQIRAENGAAKAVECIYRDLDYARSLIKRSPIKPVDPIPAASITETKPNNPETIQDPNRSSAMSKQEIGDSLSGSCGEVLLKTETESEMESSGISSEEESAPESSLMLMSAHSSVSVEDEPRLPSARSSGDFFDCQPAPVPSTSTSSVIPSSIQATISPVEGPPFHCLSGQKSDNTLVPPKSSTADQDHLPAIDPSDPKGKKPAAATNNVATTDDEGSNSSSGSSWDILSQLSKSDPPSNPDIDASFVRF